MRLAARRAVLALAGLAALDQALLWTALADGRMAGTWVAPHAPLLFHERQAEHLAELEREDPRGSQATLFDAELGWAPRPGQKGKLASYDERGARRSLVPLSDPPSGRRVVALGCSFTHGDEVGAGEGWAALLSDERADLEVANLAYGGYGLDQALLRWRRDGRALAPAEVWLGWMPAASLRVTSHLPLLVNHTMPHVLTKPRFVLAGEGLALRANPARDLKDLAALYRAQPEFLARLGADDPWIARARAAYLPLGTSLWHRSAAARLALTAWERRGRATAPWFASADAPVPRLIAALIEATAAEAQASGARLRLIVLPARSDLEAARAGRAYWSASVERARAQGLEVIDVTPALLAAGVLSEPAAWQPGGHYAPRTQRVVAAAIAAVLDAER